MKSFRIFLILSLLPFLIGLTPSITENHWQVAFNKKVTKGQLEYPVRGGRVDILTDYYAIEVEKISTWKNGIIQALIYAKSTNKQAGLALYIDRDAKAFEKFTQAKVSCEQKGIKLWLINEYVSINDIVNLRRDTTYGKTSSPEIKPDSKKVEYRHWLNTNSGVRHNSSCRWYSNTKDGRACAKHEGRACKICGG